MQFKNQFVCYQENESSRASAPSFQAIGKCHPSMAAIRYMSCSTRITVASKVGSKASQIYFWPFVGHSPETSEFPQQRASNAEKVSIWWRQHGLVGIGPNPVLLPYGCFQQLTCDRRAMRSCAHWIKEAVGSLWSCCCIFSLPPSPRVIGNHYHYWGTNHSVQSTYHHRKVSHDIHYWLQTHQEWYCVGCN